LAPSLGASKRKLRAPRGAPDALLPARAAHLRKGAEPTSGPWMEARQQHHPLCALGRAHDTRTTRGGRAQRDRKNGRHARCEGLAPFAGPTAPLDLRSSQP